MKTKTLQLILSFTFFILIGFSQFSYALTQQEMDIEYKKADEAFMNDNFSGALKLIIPIAEQGHAKGQILMGMMYLKGQGVLQDYKKAVKWFRLSSEQGDAQAQFNLGWMYYEGQGIPQDYKEAVKWHRLAVEQGFADGQCGLGEMYYGGEGVPHDYAEAIKWWKLAAEQGHEEAQKRPSFIYR